MLATLLTRAIANDQLALHEQTLDAAGAEMEEGASIVAKDWRADADTISFSDGTPAKPGVHLYVAGEDLEALLGMEDES